MYCNLFLGCKAEFSASLLQSSVSHDPSEIILICWFADHETFFIIKTVETVNIKTFKTVVLFNIFVEIVKKYFFWWIVKGRWKVDESMK